ncbi:hypothetical protein HNQ02_002318 [Flavobacterium sp. 7E]|uniref:hypothetical protein n=1 Tax=Flavobacterium sp. 7E TaxID=2735898 RepID=UPI0015701390|nr:hypothetical protein [Flavobacterium sp. 7E]NRS89389.1 hypothetical protein [Flavobacterium sp. 7E]
MKKDAIGGYFGLELSKKSEWHSEAIALNTGRNSFEYILRAKQYQKVYLPYFTCEVMLEPILKLGLKYDFYPIDEKLEPLFDYNLIQDDEVFLYTNYFGLKNSYVEWLASLNKNITIDNAQAFFSKPLNGVDTFYSARKFFGVSDGAYLFTDKTINESIGFDESYERMGHLLKRLDTSAEEGYSLFSQNDSGLVNQPIKKMSQLTQRILQSFDYNLIKQNRQANFKQLHARLKDTNLFKFGKVNDQVPMVYPYWTKNKELKKRLQENRIYCASYWPNIKNWCEPSCLEYHLMEEILCLPIDHRYDSKDMEYIINILKL